MAKNHNVDVRSTQLANAIKSIPDAFLALSMVGLVGVGILWILVFAIIRPLMLNQENSKREEAKQLNLTSLTKDYERNKARYEINWENIYLRHTGRIGNITSSSYTFAPQSVYFKGKRVDVECSSIKDNTNTIAKYNPGSLVTVIGKSTRIRQGYQGNYIVPLRYCKIQ